jgi:hypothetical protein
MNYSTAPHSRAGQLALLSRQGKIKGGLEREHRRAARTSGTFFVIIVAKD